jgi:hypothetical protein
MGKDFDAIGIATDFHWTYPVADYCTAPAAWGALFVWLAEQGKRVSLDANILQQDVFATVGTHGRAAPLPGRALVLATLAAYGVETD